MKSYKRKIVKAAVVAGLFLVVCTMIARTVHTLMLPQVYTRKSSFTGEMTLEYRAQYTGAVRRNADNTSVLAADSWIITEVCVEDGQAVQAGQALFVLDIGAHQIALKQLESQILSAQLALNGTDWTGGDRLQRQQQVEILQMQYNQLAAKMPAGGKVTAPADGTVSQLASVGPVMAGQTLAVVQTTGEAATVEFSVWTEEEALKLKESQLKASYRLNGATQRLELESPEYHLDEQTGRYLVSAVAKELTETVSDGTPVQVESVRISEPYSALVPLSALNSDGNGNFFVVSVVESRDIWGLHTLVKQFPVQVLEQNHQYAAVDTVPQEFVVDASRILQDGEQVRVMDE